MDVFNIILGKRSFLRLDYRGYTRQPSINQMQPVKNNDNLMQETVGNPSLNPSFSNYMRLMYSAFNDKTFLLSVHGFQVILQKMNL